jgi:uncharacterized protein (DUF1015 family)
LPHENVMPGPVAGRRRLMEATRANLEPILLVYDGRRGEAGGREEGRAAQSGAGAPGLTATEVIDWVADTQTPLFSIQTEDGITHRLWRLAEPPERDAIVADLARRRALIADGHHRYAACLQLQAEMQAAGHGPGPWDYGLAFLVDSAACPPRLGAIHRVLPRLVPERAVELARAGFEVKELPAGTDLPAALGRLAEQDGNAFLLAGRCGYHMLSHPDPVRAAASMPPDASVPWRHLDASVMQQLLLGQLWGMTDNETDALVYHDAVEADAAVRHGGTAVILNPVSFEAVREIAEHGERVPRKSTSFEPKPRTGLVLRTFGRASCPATDLSAHNQAELAGLGDQRAR